MKQEEGNFLSKLSDAWLIALLCVVVPGMFSTGFYLGQQQTDREAKEMLIENHELKDSLVVFRLRAASLQQGKNAASSAKLTSKTQ